MNYFSKDKKILWSQSESLGLNFEYFYSYFSLYLPENAAEQGHFAILQGLSSKLSEPLS